MLRRPLGDLCKQPTLTASAEHNAQLAYDATNQLHEPVQSIMSALDRRALALTHAANFESALRDAHVMLQLSSSSPLGYIRTAEIYSAQGKQRHALSICIHGLNKVDAKDTRYATLQQLKTDAAKRHKKRIDFMRRLPVDIVISILIPMIMKDNLVDGICPYLKVSKSWNDLILQRFKVLRFKVYGYRHLSQVIQFSRHTKSLHITSNSKGKQLGDLIGGNDFPSLESLIIEGFKSEDVQHFITALKSVSSTLTYLEVEYADDDDSKMWVQEMMLACPNLVTLRLYDPPSIYHNPMPFQQWPTLTTLSIHNEEGNNISYEDVLEIMERSPGLKELDLYPCVDVWSVSGASEYVPLLNRLRIAMFESRIHLYYQHQEHSSDELGLRSLEIDTGMIGWDEDVADDIRSIIKKYHNTLEHLAWDRDRSRNSEAIGHLQFPCLKTLGVSSTGWQIARNAPLLEELKLAARVILKHPQVLDIIPPHLKKLEFDLSRAPQPLHLSSIRRYLDRITQTLQLKELVMVFSSQHQIKNRLGFIYRLAHLERVRIQHLTDWKKDEINRFLYGLVKACPRLTCLELDLRSPPATSSVNILKRLEHLQQLKFCIWNLSHDDDTFWNAICTLPQLKCIALYPDESANDRHMQYVRGKRPDLKITFVSSPSEY